MSIQYTYVLEWIQEISVANVVSMSLMSQILAIVIDDTNDR